MIRRISAAQGEQAMRYEYPATVSQDKTGRFLVEFPDLPGVRIRANSRHAARLKAQAALSSALGQHIKSRTRYPLPSAIRKKHIRIPVLLLTAIKLTLYRAVAQKKISNVALAKQLGVTEAVVRRLLNPGYN